MIETARFHDTRVRDGRVECTCGWHSQRVFGDPSPFATWHRLSIGETIDNPYLREFLTSDCRHRARLTAEYAWAIPTERVVRKLATLSPICDMGCGTGYWAKLLRDVGAEVQAVDSNPPLEGDNHWHRREVGILRYFGDVSRGDAATFSVPSKYTLMLCWPPDGGMALHALERYGGARVIYIGEGKGGCTGDNGFHAALAEQWKLSASYEIPQWPGMHDDVCVYVRRMRWHTSGGPKVHGATKASG